MRPIRSTFTREFYDIVFFQCPTCKMFLASYAMKKHDTNAQERFNVMRRPTHCECGTELEWKEEE